MKIKRGDIYYIELYLEPGKISDHNKRSNGTLSFTGVELMDAIVSAGMPDIYLNKANKRNRKEEIYFKIKLFETYVALLPNGELLFDPARKVYLDSTEIGAINYWIGMILITVLGKKKYGYEYMVHLSMISNFSSHPRIKKHRFFSVNGKTTYKSPDLIAIKCDVSTICLGMAASMGAFLLAGGTKGKRFALPHSTIMIHQPSGGAQGQATEIQIVADHIAQTKRTLNEILAENTGQPYEVVEKDTDRDNYMTAEEAKAYGLIDGVVEHK